MTNELLGWKFKVVGWVVTRVYRSRNSIMYIPFCIDLTKFLDCSKDGLVGGLKEGLLFRYPDTVINAVHIHVHSTPPITKKKYAEILLRYRQLFIKGDVFIGE